jgi:hypothetical protein
MKKDWATPVIEELEIADSESDWDPTPIPGGKVSIPS